MEVVGHVCVAGRLCLTPSAFPLLAVWQEVEDKEATEEKAKAARAAAKKSAFEALQDSRK